MITEAQANALDAYVESDAEARVMGKIALAYCVTGHKPDAKTLEKFEKALDFYSTAQIANIVDAKG